MRLAADISGGVEALSVQAFNQRDAEEAPGGFDYVRDNIRRLGILPQLSSAGCGKACLQGHLNCSGECPCTLDDWGDKFFDDQGRLQALRRPDAEEQAANTVWECGSACECNSACKGRITQQGLKAHVTVKKTDKGWSAFAAQDIDQGAFVCQYAGELLSRAEAVRRLEVYDAQQDRPGHALLVVREVLPSQSLAMRINIDATRKGNVARFFNHSCDGGNLVPIMVRTRGDLLPHIAMFASEAIKSGSELCFRYGEPNPGQIESSYEMPSIKREPRRCLCGTAQCLGFLPADAV